MEGQSVKTRRYRLRVNLTLCCQVLRKDGKMQVGVRKVVCTCGKEMRRMGGTFGGGKPTTDTYHCYRCQKHVVVVTPDIREQEEFAARA